jgi:putative hemolysin
MHVIGDQIRPMTCKANQVASPQHPRMNASQLELNSLGLLAEEEALNTTASSNKVPIRYPAFLALIASICSASAVRPTAE